MNIQFGGQYQWKTKTGRALPVESVDLDEDNVKNTMQYVNNFFDNVKLPPAGHKLHLTQSDGEVWAVLSDHKQDAVAIYHDRILTTQQAALNRIMRTVGQQIDQYA